MTKSAIAMLMFLAGCSTTQKVVMFTADDTASAAAIASAAGMSGDATCWREYSAVLAVTAQQLGQENGGVASTLALQRSFKTLAARQECYGISVELLAALGKIPYAGPIAIQVLGF